MERSREAKGPVPPLFTSMPEETFSAAGRGARNYTGIYTRTVHAYRQGL